MDTKKPFRNITINPSFQIAQALPPSLKSTDGSSIVLKSHSDAIHVGWDAVVKLVPELYNQHLGPSDTSNNSKGSYSDLPFFIHIGAGYPGRYHLEQIAHRDGYWKGDVDGNVPPTRKKCPGRGYPCEGEKDPLSPPTLQTAIDVLGVVGDVKKELPNLVSTRVDSLLGICLLCLI